MVQQLFGDLERAKAEIKRLRGRMDAIAVGGRVNPSSITGGVQIPLPIEGAIIYGNTTPEWARLAMPTPGDDYVLTFIDGDAHPTWQLGGAVAGDDVFIINMGVAL